MPSSDLQLFGMNKSALLFHLKNNSYNKAKHNSEEYVLVLDIKCDHPRPARSDNISVFRVIFSITKTESIVILFHI